MADDWDLYAVVRSCTNYVATSTVSSTITPTLETSNREFGDSFVKVPSFQTDDHSQVPFRFPGLVDHDKDDSLHGIEDIYLQLYSNAQQSPSSASMNPLPREFQNQRQPHQQQTHPHIQPQELTQGQQHLNFRHAIIGSSLPFPTPTSPQPIRHRRRKNQQTKLTHQMTQEELSADSWAWRKYGQKPIKGSPYPRNYYRCSTSKGCTARKQVERCPTGPNIFIVSYTDEHNHPRPTRRSSLSGSSRSTLSPPGKSSSSDPIKSALNSSIDAPLTSCSSSSPIIEGQSEAEESPNIENDNTEMLGILRRRRSRKKRRRLLSGRWLEDSWTHSSPILFIFVFRQIGWMKQCLPPPTLFLIFSLSL